MKLQKVEGLISLLSRISIALSFVNSIFVNSKKELNKDTPYFDPNNQNDR